MDTNSFNPKPRTAPKQEASQPTEKPLEKTTPSNTIKLYDMVSLFKDYKNGRS